MNGKPNWYEFSVTEPGRYDLNATPAQDNTIDIEYYDSNYNPIYAPTLGRYFEAGSIYVKASTDVEKAQKATVKVEKTTITPLKEGKDGNTIKMDANSNAFYEFKVQKAGIYLFTTKAADGKKVASSIEYTRNMGNSYRTLYAGSPYSNFKVGDKLIIRMTSTEAAEFTFTVEEKATELKVGTASSEVKLGANETAYFSLNVFKDGEYAFKAQDVTEGAKLKVNVTDGNRLITLSPKSGFYTVCRAQEKSKINFTVTNPSDKEVAFKAYAEYVTYNEDLSGTNKLNNVKVTKGEAQWIAFTATESGRYTFNMADGVVMNRLHCDWDEGVEDYWLEIPTDPNDIPVGKDVKLIFCLTYDGEKDDVTTDVTVENFKPTEIDDKPFTVAKTSPKWFKYTALESGFYTFTLSDLQFVTDNTQEGGTETGEPSVEMYGYSHILQSEDYDWDETSFEKALTAGDTYYIKVMNDENIDISAKLSVSQRIPMKLEMNKTNNVTANEMSSWVTFTAPKTGTYRLQLVNNNYIEDASSYIHIYGYQRFDSEEYLLYKYITSGAEISRIFILEGSTIYFNLLNYRYYNEDLDATILPTLEEEFELGDVAEGKVNATQNIQVPSDGENGKKYIKYKITQDDEYNFSVQAQSDFYVKIYRNGTNDYYFKYPSENNGIYSLEQSAGAYAGNEFVVEINTHNDSPVNVRISMQQQYNWE